MKAVWKEKAIKLMLYATASTSILIVIGIFVFVGKEAGHFAVEPGLKELFGSKWIPVSFQKESFGLLPLITGSLLVTALATILTIPFGIGAAVYISELARPTEREILKPFIEILAGIPSVVIGFFGLVVLVPLIKGIFNLSTGLTALAGAVLLALMAIPTVGSISEDAIRSVPASYKAASLALGASKMQTIWKVTVPAALPGIEYGSTFLYIVCHFVAPRARLPSLRDFGTALRASSLETIIIGSIIHASVKQPAIIEAPNRRNITNSPSPKSPKTIEGTPASVTIASRTVRVNLPAFAYSDK